MNTNEYLARKESGGQEHAWKTPYDSTSVANSVLAGRVSYFLGTRGPAMSLDTACSSSLVALHLAAKSIERGECEVAVVGGVSLILAPWTSVAFSHSRMLSPDGACKTFDASANGYVRGEGCGVVILTSSRFSRENGRAPWAHVLGSAVNQNGRSWGLTAPNGAAQQEVIRDAQDDAGVKPEQVSYVEAHGTGTPLGDPIELNALGEVMASEGERKPWYVGSVKTNIGHLEAAAGIAGLLKTVLSLHHGQIPAHLNFRALSGKIRRGPGQGQIPTSTVPWPTEYGRRIGGVSSFGFSGSNAHVVLAAPTRERPEKAVKNTSGVLPLSARDSSALRRVAKSYESFLLE